MALDGKAVPTAPLCPLGPLCSRPVKLALVALGILAVNLGAFLGLRRMLGLPKLASALLTLWARRTRRFPCPLVKAGGWIRLMAWWWRMTF